MSRPIAPKQWTRLNVARVAILVLAVCASSGRGYAQLGAPSTGSQGSVANQLPLSGRSGQNGSAAAVETPIPGATTSVNTLTPSVQVSGSYSGSVNGAAKVLFSGKLSLREAVQRGLAYNLGAIGVTQAVRQADSLSKVSRSTLLPNFNGTVTEDSQTTNLRTFGLSFNVPGFKFPTVVGPFEYMDFRAKVSQTIADFTALNNYRSSKETLRANQLTAEDARDLVVLAVTGTYLQVIAAQARVVSARSQLDTANTLYELTMRQFQYGTVPQLDVNRSRVEALTQQQRLVSLQNDLAKQKINLARLAGLPATDQYDISDDVPFAAAPPIAADDALKQALDNRPDLKAAEAQVRAAELTLKAAHDERLPSATLNADFGANGPDPGKLQTTYTATATLRVPIWQGGRTAADIGQADATLAQRQAELEDTRGQIESQVHEAYLDLTAATSQVDVARQNLEVTQDTLNETRSRLEAGLSNNVELVQSQESLASAELDYIDSVFAHNVAKLSLARAIGHAADSLPQFLKMQ